MERWVKKRKDQFLFMLSAISQVQVFRDLRLANQDVSMVNHLKKQDPSSSPQLSDLTKEIRRKKPDKLRVITALGVYATVGYSIVSMVRREMRILRGAFQQ
jgi:ribosome-binding factor A